MKKNPALRAPGARGAQNSVTHTTQAASKQRFRATDLKNKVTTDLKNKVTVPLVAHKPLTFSGGEGL